MRTHYPFTRAALAALAIAGCTSLSSNLDTTPTNDLPNPYRTVAPWGKLPADHAKWGALNGVYVDNDGRSLWVVDRCGANPDVPPGESPFQYDSCAGSSWAPVHKLDPQGNIVKSFGAGLFVFPHKLYQDRDGNIWVVDMRAMNPRERAKYPEAKPAGHTVVKFDPDGRVLLTLGTPGVAGDPPHALTEPCAVVVAPNGDIFIAEGHSGQQPRPANSVARITKDGTFVRSFGRLGSGPVEFKTPHDIAMDAQGRLFVADRGNHRIQVLDQDGAFIAQWKQFGRPSGIFIDRNDVMYVADHQSGVKLNPGFKRGVRIGSVRDAAVVTLIPGLGPEPDTQSVGEGVVADAMGKVYWAETAGMMVRKFTSR